mgnify:FL=1|jgi:crotonobetainyl-CoA:carnitine CoA-transferase CaiB-like acyl-CoA transferase
MAINGPMTGIKVIELGNMIAAAACTRMMADLGADVIKVENTKGGDTFRAWPRMVGAPVEDECNPIFDNLNANKRSVSVDLKTPEGVQIIYKLLESADVFVTNVRTRGLGHMGLDYETLKVKFPKLVMGQLGAYGTKGPDKDKPGYDNTAFWARSGFMYGQKVDREGEPQAIPVYQPMAVGDISCACALMAGINAALLKARESGKGDRIVVPLYGMAMWMTNIQSTGTQFGYTYPKTRDISSPFGAPYLCKDGRWFMPQVTNFVRDKDKFYTAIGCEDLIGVPEYAVRTNFNKKEFNAPFIKKLEAIFATKTADEWCEIFKGFDLCYEKLYTYEEVLVDEQAIVNDYIYTMDYPEGRSFKTIRTAIRSDNTGLCEIKRGPMLGENTVEIMQKVGYGEDEINALIAKGTVSQHA